MSLPYLPKELFILPSSVFSTSIYLSSHLAVASTHTPLQGHQKSPCCWSNGSLCLPQLEQLLKLFPISLFLIVSCLPFHVSPAHGFSDCSSVYSFSSSSRHLNVGASWGFCQRSSFLTLKPMLDHVICFSGKVTICVLVLPFLDLQPRSLFWTPSLLGMLTWLSHRPLFPTGKSQVHHHLPNLLLLWSVLFLWIASLSI